MAHVTTASCRTGTNSRRLHHFPAENASFDSVFPPPPLFLQETLNSRFIVGWAISAVNDRHLTLKALQMTLKRRCPDAGLLHHSDQGCTYASEDYQTVLTSHGITCSMSRRGNCYDNAVMEAFFSTVKKEVGERYESHGDAKGQLFDYIEVFYNQRRRHSSAGRMSPAAFERKMTQAA